MTLIETTYQSLKQANLTTSRQAFSRDFVNRNKSWCSYAAHMKRDFSAAAAIDCLRSIRALQERDRALNSQQQQTLMRTEIELQEHLSECHHIAAVCDQ
jgi:hypothetical protein